jgi:hypothetical protein
VQAKNEPSRRLGHIITAKKYMSYTNSTKTILHNCEDLLIKYVAIVKFHIHIIYMYACMSGTHIRKFGYVPEIQVHKKMLVYSS